MMLATSSFGASSNRATLEGQAKPPVELMVCDSVKRSIENVHGSLQKTY